MRRKGAGEEAGSRLQRLSARLWSLCAPCLVFAIVLGLGVLCALTAREEGQVRQEHWQLRQSLAANAAGWLKGRAGDWRLFEASTWLHGSVRAHVTGLERSASPYGQTGIREFVEPGGGVREPWPLLQTQAVSEEQDSAGLVGFASRAGGEPLDERGYPLRWQHNAQTLEQALEQARMMHVREKVTRQTQPFAYVTRARGLGRKGPILVYLDVVRRTAARYHLPVHMLLAVMQVESGGRHELVSSRNAVGLMQVQPETAGMHVHHYLTRKKQAKASPAAGSAAADGSGTAGSAGAADSTSGTGGTDGTGTDSSQAEVDLLQVQTHLTDFEQNIFYGASYLHLLEKVYFRKVHDREARILCMLAAYNMGPGRFTRLFADTPQEAVRIINLYSALGLYEEIRLRFADAGDAPHDTPDGASYDYLDKVITLMLQYKKMGY